jgi:dsRNA-specific ribonuclease
MAVLKNDLRECGEASFAKDCNPNPGQKGTVGDALVADTVEAIIGAIFLDGGQDTVRRLMITMADGLGGLLEY